MLAGCGNGRLLRISALALVFCLARLRAGRILGYGAVVVLMRYRLRLRSALTLVPVLACVKFKFLRVGMIKLIYLCTLGILVCRAVYNSRCSVLYLTLCGTGRLGLYLGYLCSLSYYVCSVCLTGKSQGCGAVIVSPAPACRVIVSLSGYYGVGVAVITVIALMLGVSVVITSGGDNGVCELMVELSVILRILAAALITGILVISCRCTACVKMLLELPVMSGSRNSYRVGVTARRTCVNGLSALGTGCLSSFSYMLVSLGNAGYLLYGIVAAYADLERVAVGCTSALNRCLGIVVSVKLASFLRCEFCYGIVGEVVGLKGYVTLTGSCSLVVGCLYRFQISFVVDEPDSDTVNVLALLKLVGQSYGYPVIVTELGDILLTVVDGEVIDGAISDLRKLVGRYFALKIARANLVSGERYVLVTDLVDNAGIKGDVRVVKLDLGVLEVVCVGRTGRRSLVYGNELRRAAMLTGIGSLAVRNRALLVVMGGFVLLYYLSLGVRAKSTLERLFSVLFTGSRLTYTCNVVVAVDMLTLYVLVAILTLVVLDVLTGRAFLETFDGLNTGDIVSVGCANVLGVFVLTSVTLIGLGSRSRTGSGGSLVGPLAVVVSESVLLDVTSGTLASVLTVLLSVPAMSVSANVAVYVCIGALRADVGGITLFGTGRICNRVNVGVTRSTNGFGLGVLTLRAGVLHRAACQTARAGYRRSRSPIVIGLFAVACLTVIANSLVGTSSRTARAVLDCRVGSVVRAGLRVCSVSVGNVSVAVAASLALCVLADLTGLRIVAGSVKPLVSESISLGRLTGRAGLGCFAGSVCPAVSKRLALGLLTYRAGLSRFTGSVYPLMSKSFALSCLTYRTGLRGFAGSVLPLMTLSIKGLLFNLVTE